MDQNVTSPAGEPPATLTEGEIASAFQAVLGRPPTGPADLAYHLSLGFRDQRELGTYLLCTDEFRLRFDALEAAGRAAPGRRPTGSNRPVTVFLGDRVLTQTHRGLKIYCVPHDVDLTPHLIQTGEWERHVEQALQRLLRPGQRAADIGANIGYHTLTLAAAVGPTGEVHAFEANPALHELLYATIFVNGATPWVRLHRSAVMDRPGSIVLAAQPMHFGSGNVVPAAGMPQQYHAEYSRQVEVPAVTLDAALPPGLALDLIRIDIEGSEPSALRGGEAVIRRSPNLRIVSEWAVGMMAARADVPGFVAWLRELGFGFWRIGGEGRLDPVAPEVLPRLPHSDLVISRDDPGR
ncbi:FkbM family methyltransferase [Paracraurococcus ruber]|uniref:Methyltransferase FkbM domain-containing protein n=1 Tax=Paracraurococcus ruber TaxID=77675 RepID=A0ABS1D275_9PROT|nr:FkbM family methyltransferase [Paracraurococcus ruber]MBK1660778.1 hypothetical protein [Paracraurococcus ruber]TDG27663.1 FkbM family methyltransferase [Paracraurococcus ruber]